MRTYANLEIADIKIETPRFPVNRFERDVTFLLSGITSTDALEIVEKLRTVRGFAADKEVRVSRSSKEAPFCFEMRLKEVAIESDAKMRIQNVLT